jgi:hypothetical protein
MGTSSGCFSPIPAIPQSQRNFPKAEVSCSSAKARSGWFAARPCRAHRVRCSSSPWTSRTWNFAGRKSLTQHRSLCRVKILNYARSPGDSADPNGSLRHRRGVVRSRAIGGLLCPPAVSRSAMRGWLEPPARRIESATNHARSRVVAAEDALFVGRVHEAQRLTDFALLTASDGVGQLA